MVVRDSTIRKNPQQNSIKEKQGLKKEIDNKEKNGKLELFIPEIWLF